MANDNYDQGPQLPNYMKKQATKNAERAASQAAQSSARTASDSASRKTKPETKHSAARSADPSRRNADTARRSTQTHHAAAKKSGNTGTRTSSAARKKSKKKANGALKVLAVLATLLIVIVGIVWLTGRGEGAAQDISDFLTGKKTFEDGVKLIGVDVSGLTPEEATGLVKNAAEKMLKTVAIKINAGENVFTLTSADLGMSYNIEETLSQGIEYKKDSGVTDVAGNGAGEFDAQYTWSRDAIISALENLSATVNTAPTQPYAEPVTDWESKQRFNYIAGTEGQQLNVTDAADQIEYALRSGNFQMEITPLMNAVLPEASADELKAYTVLVAEFTTKFSAARDDETKQNRKFNIQKAADIINGNAIAPGESWSFNTVVGPRTYDLGWKGANGISGGKEYTTQAGGGICQVSTTLYNALLRGNYEILDRRAHSIPSDYVDKGLDATVDTSGIDFVWKNNTAHTAYIFARVEKVEGSSSRNTITVYIYGEPLPEGVTYKARSEVIETTPRTDTIFTQDSNIPTGYQKETVTRHDGFVAEAYLDKYVNGDLAESTLMYKDKYSGNPAEISIGTGAALQEGELPDVTWQIYGTAPTEPKT